jgi:hypothetical protein
MGIGNSTIREKLINLTSISLPLPKLNGKRDEEVFYKIFLDDLIDCPNEITNFNFTMEYKINKKNQDEKLKVEFAIWRDSETVEKWITRYFSGTNGNWKAYASDNITIRLDPEYSISYYIYCLDDCDVKIKNLGFSFDIKN